MTDRYELVELPWVDGRKYWLKDTETGWRYTMDLILADHLNEAVAAKDAEIDLLQEQNAEMQQAIADLSDLANDVVRLEAQLARIQSLVDAQAEDEGLWFKPVYVTEHIFQVALRELHAAIEDK